MELLQLSQTRHIRSIVTTTFAAIVPIHTIITIVILPPTGILVWVTSITIPTLLGVRCRRNIEGTGNKGDFIDTNKGNIDDSTGSMISIKDGAGKEF